MDHGHTFRLTLIAKNFYCVQFNKINYVLPGMESSSEEKCEPPTNERRYAKQPLFTKHLLWRVAVSIPVLDAHATGKAAVGPLLPLAPPTMDGRCHLLVGHARPLMTHTPVGGGGEGALCTWCQWSEHVYTHRVIVSTAPHRSTFVLYGNEIIVQEWE